MITIAYERGMGGLCHGRDMSSEVALRIGDLVDDLFKIIRTALDQGQRQGTSSYKSVQAELSADLSLHLLSYIRFLEGEGLLEYDRLSEEIRITESGEGVLLDPGNIYVSAKEFFADQIVDEEESELFSDLFSEGSTSSEEFEPSSVGADEFLGGAKVEAQKEALFGADTDGEVVDAKEEASSPDVVAGQSDSEQVEDQQEDAAFDMGAHEVGARDGSPSIKQGGSMGEEAFERIEELGSGGIGTVYRGRQVRLNREVAIKEIREIFNVFAGVQRSDILERFRTIVQTQASLLHPNIVQLIDIDTSGEYPFAVMQFAPNGNLRRVIDYGDRPPLKVSLKYFLQILHALNTAHDQGVVHGSLKPENVVLDQAGNALLTDFGISRIVEREGGRGNQVYVGVGTVAYMSPEQFQDPNLATTKSDIYSLGIMFYEMLTGKVPGRRSPMPSSFFPDIPRSLDDIFDRMSMDREEDRYDSIDEIITDIYASEEVLSILDKRSGVLFLRDPLLYGTVGLGEEYEAETADLVANSGDGIAVSVAEEIFEESEPVESSGEELSEVSVEEDDAELEGEDQDVEESGDVLDKLDKYGALFEED